MTFADSARHIILIDDSDDVRFHLGNLLVQMGYTVEALAQPQAVLNRTRWTTPTVILLDMRMPQMMGLEVQQGLARMGQDVPIVFISGESQPQEIVQALKGGAVDFLIKPFGQADLARALTQAFQIEAQRRQDRRKVEQLQAHYQELSPREQWVLPLILKGHTNKSLGEILSIQAGTVKKHRAAIYEKFLVADLSELLERFRGHEDLAFADSPRSTGPRDKPSGVA